MDVKTTRGTTVKLMLKGRQFDQSKFSRSSFQRRIGKQLKEEYPHDLIYTEVPVPEERFVLDFFIPSLRIVIECQGRQHQEYVPFFHGTKRQFHRAQDRDLRKKAWCELNGFRLIEVFDG